jgi:hypothetical protein
MLGLWGGIAAATATAAGVEKAAAASPPTDRQHARTRQAAGVGKDLIYPGEKRSVSQMRTCVEHVIGRDGKSYPAHRRTDVAAMRMKKARRVSERKASRDAPVYIVEDSPRWGVTRVEQERAS